MISVAYSDERKIFQRKNFSEKFQVPIVPGHPILQNMNIWNLWASSYRNMRAMGAAAALLVAIVAMLLLRCNPMIGREPVTGTVVKVEADGLQPHGSGGKQSRVVVSTPDSVQVRLFLPPPVPEVGDVIPLIEEQYENGDKLYYLDYQMWRMDGPS